MTLLSMSIGGSILVLLMCVFRVFFPDKASGRTYLIPWCIAVFRFLFPFFLPLNMSFYSLFTVTGNNYTPEEILNSISVSITELPLFNYVIDPHRSNGWNWKMLRLIWFTGAAVCAIVHLVIYLRSCKSLSESLPADRAYIRQWKENHQLRRSYQIRVYDRISSPIAYGVFRPVILLDKDTAQADEEKLNLVLTHEFLHIWRHHIMLKWATFLACMIHWFNPLVWLLAYFVQRDIESDCDEAVVQTLGESKRLDYAQMLLESQPAKQNMLLFTTHFARQLEQRTRDLLDETHRKKSKKNGVAVVVGLLMIGIAQPQVALAEYEPNQISWATYSAQSVPKNTSIKSNQQIVQSDNSLKTIPANDTIIFSNNGRPWKYQEGEEIIIYLQHTDIGFPVGQGMEIGYLLDGQQYCLYKGQNKTGVKIAFPAPKTAEYTFYVYCKSSDPIILQSFQVG